MRRGGGDLGRALTLGGRVPAGLGGLLLAILIASVFSWVTRNDGWAWLSPRAIVEGGQVWRLASWAFVQRDPLALLFGGLILFQFGGQLFYATSDARIVGHFVGIAAGASLITVLVSFFIPAAGAEHIGMWPVANAFLVMWALRYPDQQVNIWGVLPLTGRTMALLVLFGTVLFGLYAGGIAGLFAFTPHFAALAIAWGLSRGRFPTRRWKLRARDWWSEQQFKRRASHLKVVKKNGSDDPPKWMN